jgi:F420-dependent oxidoreductase-like protein
VKLGLQIPYFTWPGGPPKLGSRLAEVVRTADDAGFSSIWVMDHLFQIQGLGPPELEMLEAYTTLGFIAGHTSRARVGTMVTGVTYRHPAILVKQVTTLDVLSGGRAWMGIGAAWFEREHLGLGVRFPPVSERFERLEEALQIALQMWSDDNGPYQGKHYQLAETLNSPQALTKPHPPILVGGSGERKTLRLVARYADACNVFGDPPTVRHKLQVLRRHCETEGRNYDDIEKTVLIPFDLGPDGSATEQLVQRLAAYAEVGVQTVIGGFAVDPLRPVEIMGREVLPQVASL